MPMSVRLAPLGSLFWLIMATSAVANEGAHNNSEEKVSEISEGLRTAPLGKAHESPYQAAQKQMASALESFRQNCQPPSVLDKLVDTFGKDPKGSNTACDARAFEGEIAKVLSDTNTNEITDSSYREWYDNASKTFLDSAHQISPATSLIPQIKTQNILTMEMNNSQKSKKSPIYTVDGYRSIDDR